MLGLQDFSSQDPVFLEGCSNRELCSLASKSVPHLLTVDDFFPQMRTRNLTKLGKDDRPAALPSALAELNELSLVYWFKKLG